MYEIIDRVFPERNVKRLAFADALKEECREFLESNLGISPFTTNEKEKELIRPFLVTYGTHLRRKLDPDCWIKVVSSTISLDEGRKNFVITDARFPNELKWIKENEGFIIHVSRDGIKPANIEEEENDPLLKEMSDMVVSLPTFKEDYLIKCKNLIKNKLRNPLIWS